MTRNGETVVDGRVRRGERNRDAIVDALLALLAEGDPHPPARDIAARAGVSVRSVFQHFDDLETLYAALVERQLGRVRELTTPLDTTVAFSARLDRYVLSRSDLYEQVTPVRRATLLAAAGSPTLQRGLADAARDHARDVSAAFKPELAAFDHPADTRAALIVATAWETWDGLRRTQRLSVPAARRVITSIVSSVLTSPGRR